MLEPAERACQAKSSGFFRILREGGAKQGTAAPRPRLSKKGIRVEVVKERFVGPLARLLSGQGIWWVGWRAEMWHCGGEAQVVEDLPDDRQPLDHGDDFHRSAALGTEQRIDLVDLRYVVFAFSFWLPVTPRRGPPNSGPGGGSLRV